MAIARDASSNAGESASVSSVTYAHTTGASLSNGAIAVSVNTRNSAGNANLDGIVSSGTYAGVALKRAQINEWTSSTPVKGELWYGVAPTSGSNNVVINLTGTTSFVDVYAITYSGVDQTIPIANSIGNNASAQSPTLSVETIINNAWTQDAIYHKIASDMTIDSNRVQEGQLSPNTNGDRDAVGTYRGIASAGNTSHQWTTTGVDDYAWVIAVLRPAGVYATDKVDIIAEANGRGSGSSKTISITVPSGFENLMLIVGTSVQDSNHSNFPITGITSNGNAMTKIRHDEATGNNRTELWRYIAPTAGTYDIVVTATGSLGEIAVQAVVFNNVIQSASGIDNNTGATGTSGSPSCTLTPNSNNTTTFSVLSAEERLKSYGTQASRNGKSLQDQSFENCACATKYIQTAGATALAYGILSSQSYATSACSLAYVAPSGGASNIAKVENVDFDSIGKLMRVANASIGKVANVAV